MCVYRQDAGNTTETGAIDVSAVEVCLCFEDVLVGFMIGENDWLLEVRMFFMRFFVARSEGMH